MKHRRLPLFALILTSAAACCHAANLPTRPLTAPPVPFASQRAAAAIVQTFQSAWVGQEIVAGSKRIAMNQDGVVVFYSEGRQVGKFVLPFAIVDKGTGKSTWLATDVNWPKECFDLSRSGFTGGKDELVYRKTFVRGGKTAECITSVRLRPDGKVQIHYRWTPFDSPEFDLIPKTAMFIVPPVLARGGNFIMDGTTRTVPESDDRQVWSLPRFTSLELFPNAPGLCISLFATPLSGELIADCRPDTVMFRVSHPRGRTEIEWLADISKGLPAGESGNTAGGINFKTIDALELPDFNASRNLVQNSSFEQGLDCYWGENATRKYEGPETWDKQVYTIDTAQPRFGTHCLKLLTAPKSPNDFRFIGYPFKTFPVPLSAGKYTFSLYARCEPGEQTRLSVFFPNAAWLGTRKKSLPIGWKSWQEAGAQKVFALTPEWRRYAFTFEVPESMPVYASIGADSVSGKSSVLLDGLQLEAGAEATDYTARPVEARLLTSRPDNFLTPSDPVDARLEIAAAPGASGTASIRVTGFFGTEALQAAIPFTCDAAGKALVALPLDGKLPRGIFVIRTQYTLPGGISTYSHHRLAVMDSLENKHRLKALFAEDYGDKDDCRFNFRQILDRYRKIGIGGKNHTYQWNREIWEEYANYGIQSTDSTMYSVIAPYVGIHSSVKGFALMRERGVNGLAENDPRILLRDFHYDANGDVTDEYLEKFKDIVATLAKENPWIPMWAFGIEIYSKFPVEWWSRDGSPENAYRNYAKILKAFYQGVKLGNPKALVYQDAPSNMSPERGIAETGHLLAEVNKLGGVKFDMIGIHNYRKSPENPDLDADTQTLFATLAKNGYGDTPIFWPEGMHYGPYSVPQWGIESASWLPPSCWYYGTLSYDMGWAEKISAAWRARSWLVALKYQDRIKSLMSSAYINNFEMDLNLTPYATQKISNTLGRLLGDASFKKDIRFAPYLRCYVFEDAQKRPVAAVWCHHPKVDAGTQAAPEITADFGGSLAQVFDLVECERTVQAKGEWTFSVSSFPLFFRGKPGTLADMVKAFENAAVASGEGVSPIVLAARPTTPDRIEIATKNSLSRAFSGTVKVDAQTKPLDIASSASASILLDAPKPLSASQIIEEKLPVSITSGTRSFTSDLSFRGFLCQKAPGAIMVDGDTADWDSVEPIPLENRVIRDKRLQSVNNADFSGWFKAVWTPQGLYLCVKIVDDQYVVKPFARPADRWNNDALQIYFDSFCDARSKQQQGYDENDYDYAIHAATDGATAQVFRSRTPDPQLGLATQAPQDRTLAPEIPAAFKRTADGYVYEMFFPSKYLLPIRLEEGSAIGFSLMANDRDSLDGDIKSSLTLTPPGTESHNRPHLWPVMLLWK